MKGNKFEDGGKMGKKVMGRAVGRKELRKPTKESAGFLASQSRVGVRCETLSAGGDGGIGKKGLKREG